MHSQTLPILKGHGDPGFARDLTDHHPQVLAITADMRLYSNVLTAVDPLGWSTEWARTARRAVDIQKSNPAPIVIFDSDLPDVDWVRVFDRLSAVATRPRLLLAAGLVDEDLWRMVILYHGYDAVERSACAADLRMTFHFAGLAWSRTAALRQRLSGCSPEDAGPRVRGRIAGAE
jgi:hypothetical protein